MKIPRTLEDFKDEDTQQLRLIVTYLRIGIELVENEINKRERIDSIKSRIEYLDKITDPSKITCSYMKLLWYIKDELKSKTKRSLTVNDIREIMMMKPIVVSEGTTIGEFLGEMERMNYITMSRLGNSIKVVTK